MCGTFVTGELAASGFAIERMISEPVSLRSLQVQLLENPVVVGGDEDLNPRALQFEKDSDHGLEQLGVQVGFRFVPEEYRAVEQRAVLDQQPEQTELAHSFGKQGKFQIALSVAEMEFFVLDSDCAVDRLLASQRAVSCALGVSGRAGPGCRPERRCRP